MAHKKNENENDNPFVDFLLEDEDELQLAATGEIDESANDFKIDDSGAVEMSSTQDNFDPDEPTKPVHTQRAEVVVDQDENTLVEVVDEITSDDQLKEPTQNFKSEDFATVITAIEGDSGDQYTVEESELSEFSNGTENLNSNEYPTEVNVVSFSEPEVEIEQLQEIEDQIEQAFEVDPIEASAVESKTNLQVSENLKKAQDKIIEQENEIQQLRMDNQDLGAAGEVLRRKTDELSSEVDRLGGGRKEAESRLKDEIQHSQMRLQGKQQEIQDLKVKVESLELRLKRDLQMVRVRERELENRLELVRLENTAVLRSKDEHILEMKRKNDQNQIETELLKDRIKKLADDSDEKQDKIRRTVRTLRLALNMLDEEDKKEIDNEYKKSG